MIISCEIYHNEPLVSLIKAVGEFNKFDMK